MASKGSHQLSSTGTRKIHDHCVTLPSKVGEPAYVTSNKRPHLHYAVYNPETEWGYCECLHSMKGNLCKHHLKVLRMIRPDLVEGGIVKVCGTLYGTSRGGISQLVQFPKLPEMKPKLTCESDLDRAPKYFSAQYKCYGCKTLELLQNNKICLEYCIHCRQRRHPLSVTM